jgi:pheromone shutdown protein TraB
MTYVYIICIATIHASILWKTCTSFSAASTSHSRSSSALRSQILDFIEPTTGVPVKLIGAMHYNPASIKLTEDAINELAEEDKLGSIIIESCDIRWNATLDNELVKNALQSEMRAAHDLGLLYNRPVVLGDQRINVTVDRLTDGAKEAVMDLLKPFGGWERLYRSIDNARREAIPIGDEYLGIDSLFDPKLLGATPVSLVKYPLSYMVKSPIAGVLVLGLLVLLGGSEASDASSFLSTPESASDLFVSMFISFVETVIFARIFLKELLAERNDVLAMNILEQCKNYKSDNDRGWASLFLTKNEKSIGTIYARGSVAGKPEEGKTVVAVLGLAHCNGIKKILTEEKQGLS